jgi:hypothetical protein
MAIFAAVIITGCVKIQTGQTIDEAIESNEVRAKEIRVEWRQRLDRAAGDKERALLVKGHIDSTSAMIIRYGFKVADEWQKGNEGRGVDIEASEMRQVVNSWVGAQRPYLMAYEDNMEYGVRLVAETKKYGQFPQEAYNLFDSLAHHYYDTYSIVFYPNESVQFYEESLLEVERKHREFSDRLTALLR